MAGGGLVVDGGLTAPDGMAILLASANGAEVRWRQIPPEIGPATNCDFTVPIATEARLEAGLFDAEGRLVLTGTATFPGLGKMIFLLRFLYPDCTLDTSFNFDGYFTFDLDDDVSGLRVRSQIVSFLGVPVERLLVAGNRTLAGPGDYSDTLVLRLTENGALDSSFDEDGWASLDYQDQSQLLADFVVDGDGRIYLGANIDLLGADPNFLLARLTSDGELDGSFDMDGWRPGWFAADAADTLGAMEIAANGDLLLAGTADFGTSRQIAVSRRTNATNHDALFPSAGDLSAVTAAVLQGDRKLLLAGWSNGLDGDFDPFAFRVLIPTAGNPAADPTFGAGAGADPLTYYSFDDGEPGTDAAYAIDLSGGRPVLFGEENFGDPQGIFVARLTNAYIFVDGFESGDSAAW
jgi:uncharacterized delta-60 repeat protein